MWKAFKEGFKESFVNPWVYIICIPLGWFFGEYFL